VSRVACGRGIDEGKREGTDNEEARTVTEGEGMGADKEPGVSRRRDEGKRYWPVTPGLDWLKSEPPLRAISTISSYGLGEPSAIQFSIVLLETT